MRAMHAIAVLMHRDLIHRRCSNSEDFMIT